MLMPVISLSDITPDLKGRLIAGTGHRPNKTGGFNEEALSNLKQFAIRWLEALAPRGLVSGVALGWDTALAEAADALGLPFVACVPFKGQELRWPLESQQIYHRLLERAAKVIVCSKGGYSAQAMQVRNIRMVDIVMNYERGEGLLLALWNNTPGGTKNCIDYAKSVSCPTINAWHDFVAFNEEHAIIKR